eukprot:scaffold11030_cov63-Phaeocystis_antarctica.AAC.1
MRGASEASRVRSICGAASSSASCEPRSSRSTLRTSRAPGVRAAVTAALRAECRAVQRSIPSAVLRTCFAAQGASQPTGRLLKRHARTQTKLPKPRSLPETTETEVTVYSRCVAHAAHTLQDARCEQGEARQAVHAGAAQDGPVLVVQGVGGVVPRREQGVVVAGPRCRRERPARPRRGRRRGEELRGHRRERRASPGGEAVDVCGGEPARDQSLGRAGRA